MGTNVDFHPLSGLGAIWVLFLAKAWWYLVYGWGQFWDGDVRSTYIRTKEAYGAGEERLLDASEGVGKPVFVILYTYLSMEANAVGIAASCSAVMCVPITRGLPKGSWPCLPKQQER